MSTTHSPESVFIHSRGVRIHALVQGARNAPLIVLIHGFGGGAFEFAELMRQLSRQPVRVAAVDLRGYGTSDKTPRGYDLTTAASDMAGVIRGLGYARALVVGHGYGGLVAWTLAAHEPDRVESLVTLSSAHPIVQAQRITRRPWRHRHRVGRILNAQLPRLAEARLTKDDAALAERIFRNAVAPGFRDTELYRENAALRRQAMLEHKVAHCASEYQRWLFRMRFRPEGIMFHRSFPQRTQARVLAVEGSMDPGFDADVTQRSVRRGAMPGSASELLYGVGHYPHIEDPPQVAELLANTLST